MMHGQKNIKPKLIGPRTNTWVKKHSVVHNSWYKKG